MLVVFCDGGYCWCTVVVMPDAGGVYLFWWRVFFCEIGGWLLVVDAASTKVSVTLESLGRR